MWEPSMISYCVSICLDVTCKSPYVIFKSKRIYLYWLVQYKSSLVIHLSNLRSWTSESFPDLSCYKNSLASENTFFLSFFLLIENYYSFASAEAILATFSLYDSKRSIGFVRFFLFLFFSSFWPLGHFHWRRFIGGRDFVSHIIQTLFTDHSFTHSFATEEKSDNQLKKRKDNALNEYVINEQ